MGSTAVVAGAMATIAILGGCGGDNSKPPSVSTTTVAATPATPKPTQGIRPALLSAPDIPGTTPTMSGKTTDVSACFPGNPLGARFDPDEVVGPDLGIAQGRVQRTYSSSARLGGPRQAAAYIDTVVSAAGTACLTNLIKAAIGDQAGPPKADAAGLSGTAKPAAVADGGVVLAIRGSLKVGGAAVPLAFDLLAFHKGGLLVLVSASALRGANVPGQAVALGNKVAGRLP